MNQSFGNSMLTGGIRGELHEDARRMDHLRAVRALRSDRQAARSAARQAAITAAVADLRARFVGRPSQTTPDCCPA